MWRPKSDVGCLPQLLSILFFFFKRLIIDSFLYVWVFFMHVCECITHMKCPQRSGYRALPLELELQLWITMCLVTGAASSLDCWTICPAPLSFVREGLSLNLKLSFNQQLAGQPAQGSSCPCLFHKGIICVLLYCFLCCFVWDKVSLCSSGWTRTHSVD